jgi:DNA-directed RNA polymerase specialized sigma24 family protein
VVANKELLEQAQRRLSAQECQLVELRRKGLSWDEIAASLGGTAGGLRNQLARALDRVAQDLRLDEP